MDDKKKIIILSIAVAVAITLVVLITMTKKGGVQPTLPLPAAPPFTPPGGVPGAPSQAGQVGQPGQAGQPANVSPAAASSGRAPNAFLPKPSPGVGSGFVLSNGGVLVASGTPQPEEYAPTPMSFSDAYIISQVPSGTFAYYGPGSSLLGATSTDALVKDYLANLNKLPIDQAKADALLKTVGNMPIPSVNEIQQLLNMTSTNPSDIINSLTNFQGLTADQVNYLKSLEGQTSLVTSTASLNQGLINMGMQNLSLVNSALQNANGGLSTPQLQSILQQFQSMNSQQCARIVQDINNVASSSGTSFSDWFSAIAGGQFAPMLNCGGAMSPTATSSGAAG
jgi:hypothetical protein